MALHQTRKLRVVHYCNQLSIGGTERTMEIFCKYLDRSQFDVYVVSRYHSPSLKQKLRVYAGAAIGIPSAVGKKKLWASMNAREHNFRSIVGPERLFFAKSDSDLRKTLLKLKPDILHVHYSGNPEAPTSDGEVLERIPLTVTTNQFERENTAPAHQHVKRMFFVSKWMLENRATWASTNPRAEVFYNPIEVPCSHDSLRDELGIPKDAFVIGRVGRADPGIHDPISLRAFRKIENDKTYFLAVSPPENMLRQAKSLHLKNFIALSPSTDGIFLSRFYNTIDVMAHARRDGETFGCVIAEAMIHGKPVVSHLTPFMNAQKEVIGDSGYVCEQDDWQTYAEKLSRLRDDKLHWAELSARAQKRAFENFEARTLTRRLEKTYLQLLKGAP